MKTDKSESIVLISVILFSLVLILIQHFYLNTSYTINPKSGLNVYPVTDSIRGGKSKATLEQTDDFYLMTCHIVESTYQWPFCEIFIELGLDENKSVSSPLDLSSYSSVKIDAEYIGESQSTFRFNMRSYHPTFSLVDDNDTWKYTGIEYDAAQVTDNVPLDVLQVATWWLVEQKIPINLAAPDLENVVAIEFSTGNAIKSGTYKIKVNKIEFYGKIFTYTQVFAFITLVWIVVASLTVFRNFTRYDKKLAMYVDKQLELKNHAQCDSLTGALNRFGLEQAFDNKWCEYSVIFIDIDFFKVLNDTYGHLMGDKILTLISELMNKNTRSSDLLCRWGGEEFIIVCPHTNLASAHSLAESLRFIIANFTWPRGIIVTASFGVAQCQGESFEQLLKRADEALYEAKSQGRNRVNISYEDCAFPQKLIA